MFIYFWTTTLWYLNFFVILYERGAICLQKQAGILSEQNAKIEEGKILGTVMNWNAHDPSKDIQIFKIATLYVD